MAQNPTWGDAQKVPYLANLLDDGALDFFDELHAATHANYEQLKNELLDHYRSVSPQTTQWSLLTKRIQGPNETVTEYYDALLRLAKEINVPIQQFLFIFLDGLPDDTKNHIALSTHQPVNARDALNMAKNFQAVTHYTDPAKRLLKHIRDKTSDTTETPLTSTVELTNDGAQFDYLNTRMDHLSQQLDRLADQIDHNFLGNRDNQSQENRPFSQEPK